MSDVHRIRDELSAILDVVKTSGGPSDISSAESIATKALLLSAASHFEREICTTILECAQGGGARPIYVAFIERQGLDRRYHAMFSWEHSNLNKFFSLFGDVAKLKLSAAAKEEDISSSIGDFIYLGSKRNELVHQNFAGFSLDVTFDDVWRKYESANVVPSWIKAKLTEL
jgi:hypothetical protein